MRSISELAIAHLPEHLAVRLAHWRTRPGAVVWQPGPVQTGNAATGRRLANGIILFDGQMVETKISHPWDIEAPNAGWAEKLHGHGWLDDAAATDDPAVWALLSEWVWVWLDRHEDASGAGWRPDLVARRMVRWINYTVPLLRGQPVARSDTLFRALGAHLRFLSARWQQTELGGERIEALAGLLYGLISLEGDSAATLRALRDLASTADTVVGPDGAIPSRNPAELASIVEQLVWIDSALRDLNLETATGHAAALRRAVPVLRSLIRADGSLPRMHGGDGGPGERLVEVLDRAPGPHFAPPNPAMGYLKLQAGKAVAIVDAAPTPKNPINAHSSGLALELTVDGQPIVISRGSGRTFGDKSRRLGRRRGSHSSIEIAGVCPATLQQGPRGEMLTCPGVVRGHSHTDGMSAWAMCESTEYEAEFGLLLERRVHLDGATMRLSGEDTGLATRAETRARIATLYPPGGDPCAMTLRFHLHPDVKAHRAAGSDLIGLILPDASRWTFRCDAAEVALAPTRYFDPDRPRPRPSLQIVATSYLIDFWGRISWTLQKINEGG